MCACMCSYVCGYTCVCGCTCMCVEVKADVCLPQSSSAVFAEVSQLNLELINMVSLGS